MVEKMNIQHNIQTIPAKQVQQVKPPKLYNVLLLNDDFTPMDFVVAILEQVFFLSNEKAEAVMMTVHLHGRAVCGIYAKDIAQMKVDQVFSIAQANEHPLQCIMEEEQ